LRTGKISIFAEKIIFADVFVLKVFVICSDNKTKKNKTKKHQFMLNKICTFNKTQVQFTRQEIFLLKENLNVSPMILCFILFS